MEDLTIGSRRTFSNYDKIFTIRAILVDSGVSLDWIWGTKINAESRERIIDSRTHVLNRVELLGDINIQDANLELTDAVILGFTLDDRVMQVPLDKYAEVLAQIEGFQKIKDSL